jgi:hypothetical protein
MACSSTRQQQQRASLDALARMAAADGFSPGAARPIQPAYPDYQNQRATEEAWAAIAAPTAPTANPTNPNTPTVPTAVAAATLLMPQQLLPPLDMLHLRPPPTRLHCCQQLPGQMQTLQMLITARYCSHQTQHWSVLIRLNRLKQIQGQCISEMQAQQKRQFQILNP